MQKMITPLVAALFCGLFMPLCAFGGDEGLYPAAPPAGSAFIRFFNGSAPLAVPVSVRGKSYGSVPFGNASPYAPVAHGNANLSFNGKTVPAELKEGAYYTAVLIKGKPSVLEEPASESKLKSQIILINASSAPDVNLKTADGAATVVKAVNTAKLDGRSVNPVKVPFSVYSSANKIGDLEPHMLERGMRYAVIVYDGPNGKPTATFN